MTTTASTPLPPGGAPNYPAVATGISVGIPASRRKQATTTTATATIGATPIATTASSGVDSDSVSPTSRRPAPSDPLSDTATSALIRRVLCPQQLGDKNRHVQAPIEELLPPLTSRNDVDLQLYAFLAIILRDFVQSWYGKVTTDESFVAEIVHIVAHCTRALEQRARKVDLESLLLDEVPDLLEKHIEAYRIAHRTLPSSPIQVDSREVYHSLLPLPHLSPVPQPSDEASIKEQASNEVAYRQLLVQAVLAVLLPTEDLENPCLTALVGQIFSELIIGNVIANKAAQPWLLWEGICILARVLEEKRTNTTAGPLGVGQSRSRSRSKSWSDGKPPRRFTVHGFFLSIINLVIFFITSVRLLAAAVMAPSSLPPRVSLADDGDGTWSSMDNQGSYYDEEDEKEEQKQQPTRPSPTACTKVPILEFSAWSCVARLVELPSRMPWLSGFGLLLQHGAINGPGHFGRLNGTLDRFLSHCIQSILHPSHLPSLLRTLRGLLFPNNNPGKPSLFPPSSDAELHALRRRAASAVLGLVPEPVARLYLGGRLPRIRGSHSDSISGGGGGLDASDHEANNHEKMVDEVEQLLMVLSDDYCNKHVLYSILELVLVRLMPELTEKGVQELWDERLG